MLPQVLYVVMDRSGTSVRSTRVRSRTSRWVVHSPVHHDGHAYVPGLRVVLYTTLRLPQRQLLRLQSKDCATALRGSGFSLFLPNVSLLRPAGVRVVATETVMSAFGLSASSTGIFNNSMVDYTKKMKNNAIVGAVSRFSKSLFLYFRKYRKPWRRRSSTFTGS